MRKKRLRRTTSAVPAKALFAIVVLALSLWHFSLLHSLSRSGGPSEADGGGSAGASRRSRSNLSFGVLVHLGTVFPAEEIIENQIDSLTRGWDGSVFDQVYVYYDRPDRMEDKDRRWQSFSNKLSELRSAGRVTDFVPLNRSDAVPDLMGNGNHIEKDAMLWASHQFLVHDCATDYCALFTHDIMAYGGGGLGHAVDLLEREPRFVFAIPPRADNDATWNTEKSEYLQAMYQQPGSVPGPYPVAVGLIETGAPSESASCIRGVPRYMPVMSTRHFVAHRGRFLSRLPFRPQPSQAAFFESHPGVNGATAILTCEKGTGLLFHPPPWNTGEALFKSCRDVASLQRAVDNPNGLAVGQFNNMIRESWTEACEGEQLKP